MLNSPLVTIGVASYNNSAYIRETLDSIRLQTYANIELIIVDDASKDNSVEVIKQWMKDFVECNARLIVHEINQGVCRVCNRLISEAKGEFISLVASDDTYIPEKTEVQLKYLLALPENIALVYSDVWHMNEQSERLEKSFFESYEALPIEGEFFEPLILGNFIPALSVLVRRSVYENVGNYDESLSFEDWDMWLRVSRSYGIAYIPQKCGSYRLHNQSAWRNRSAKTYRDAMAILEKHWGVSKKADELIKKQMIDIAQILYQLGDYTHSKRWLKLKWQQDHTFHSLGLWLGSSLNIPISSVIKIKKSLQQLRFIN
ncbi:glycosyltransferase [Hymenobacter koreensis]|uniref:Glycosyltransferase 2-like domain-containing protein n=1 Tax=Hymenobacter koreensis TaxID=1084523 RepID=A0ABP8ITY3_9BACT